MLVGLPIALLAFAQAASAPGPASGPPAPAATIGPGVRAAAPDGCRNMVPAADTREIIVCAQKPQGYRIDPDVMQAHREARNRSRPRPPEMMKDNSCATVGPMGCRGSASVDLVSAGVVLAEILARAAKGENVGKMFVTDPQPSEYELYLEAKKDREAKEAEAAAKAKSRAARSAAAAAGVQPTTGPVPVPQSATAPVTATPAR